MEDDFALFDPLQPAPAPGPSPAPDQEKVRAGGGAGRDTSVVLEDWDLLGGGQEVSQEVSQEVRPGDNSSPGAGAGSHAAAARSTTSFFLLDLDTNDGGAATLGAAVTATLASDHRADSAADSIDDDLSVASEVLSVAGDTLPLEAGSDAQEPASDQPQSGFFFHSLLESDEPRGTQQTRARPSDTVPGVDSGASGDSAGVGDSSAGPKFHIGSTVLSRDQAAVPAPAEAGLPSLLDVAIPQPSVRPDLVTQEATVTEVEVFTAEDAEDDSVDGCVISSNPVMDAEYKQLEDQLDNPNCGPQLEEPSYSDQLSEQLRPVFEMCDPNKEGLISIQHLQDMCRENGQVR